MHQEASNAIAPSSELQAASAVRGILNLFEVPQRLDEIREYVWRGGTMEFVAQTTPTHPDQVADAYYLLSATWESAAPEIRPTEGQRVDRVGVAAGESPDGLRWTRSKMGYSVRVGMDVVRAPTSIYVRSNRLFVLVPIYNRPDSAIEGGLRHVLAEYRETFLATAMPLSEAREAGLRLIRLHHL